MNQPTAQRGRQTRPLSPQRLVTIRPPIQARQANGVENRLHLNGLGPSGLSRDWMQGLGGPYPSTCTPGRPDLKNGEGDWAPKSARPRLARVDGRCAGPVYWKWDPAAMKKSIGIESITLTREAYSAFFAQPAISGGAGVPDSADALVAAMIFF